MVWKPVAFPLAIRHVDGYLESEATQGKGEDGRAGQAVGIEVAEDKDPFTTLDGLLDSMPQQVGVRQHYGVVEVRRGSIEVGGEIALRRVATGHEHGQRSGSDAPRVSRPAKTRRVDGGGLQPTVGRLDGRHRAEGAIGGSTPTYRDARAAVSWA